ncbi:MAG: tRNA threonylcarbamoyladenosine dehydratase [Spirochaetales bacterium]|nr:tRNA threonylcarbamoyladenosine dehydratase [Spirochaetales bacterium]
MNEQFSRTELILGHDALERLNSSRIIVFGLGGVGSYVVEALARSGVGSLTLVDNDEVCLSNLNRQLIALHSTLGLSKVDASERRILDINPSCNVTKMRMFYLPENADSIDLSAFDYVVDCIDTVSAKIELAVRCQSLGVPLISSMGTGNKLDPSLLKVADISKTSVCPLARVMRHELSKRGVKHLKCVYSTEEPLNSGVQDSESGKRVPGSTAFVPSSAGLLIASVVVRDLTGN